MNDVQRKIIAGILIVILAISCLALSLYYDAFYAAPSRYQVRYETLSSVFIPDQMSGIRILYFSDLDYGTFVDEKRLEKLTNEINELSPDAVIFGGDLFDEDYHNVKDADRNVIKRLLGGIEAPLGKFAVLGDTDHQSEAHEEDVRNILFESDFEVLTNSSVLLRNAGSGSITITGIDSGLYGIPDTGVAFANVGRAVFNIAVCHTPDTAEQVPVDLTNYMLAGHSHGGQAWWGFGALYTPLKAELYFRGKNNVRGYFTLDITNGTGTTKEDVRFLANAEIVLYTLEHKAMTDQ